MITGRSILRAWQLCREVSVDLFARSSIDAGSVPGWTALGWGVANRSLPAVSGLEALRALELQAREQAPSAIVGLVATVPGTGRSVQTTRDVARSVVQDARRELLIVGYSITDREFREQVIRKGVSGVRVTIVSDRTGGHARELLREWPAEASPVTALEGVEAVRGSFLVHPKVIVADRRTALLGSANFSGGGLRTNFELGCLLQGSVAGEIADLVESLASDGWLVRAQP